MDEAPEESPAELCSNSLILELKPLCMAVLALSFFMDIVAIFLDPSTLYTYSASPAPRCDSVIDALK